MSQKVHYGPWLAVGVVTLAIAAAAGSWWYQYATTRQTQSFLGAKTALLVARAPIAELLEMASPDEATGQNHDEITIGGHQRRVVRRVDLTRQRGFVNFRHALRQDESYEGYLTAAPGPLPVAAWSYALRFRDGDRSAALAIDRECQYVAAASLGSAAVCSAPMTDGMRQFFAEALKAVEE